MTNRSLTALVLKIFGVMWLFNGSVSLVNTTLQYFGRESGQPSLWNYTVRTNTIAWMFWALFVIVLLRFANAIARMLFPTEESLAIAIDASTLQTVGFTLLAVYLGIHALRDVALELYALLAGRGQDARFLPPGKPERLAGAVVQLCAAVWLLFGTQRLLRFLRSFQEPLTSPADGGGGAPPPSE